MTDETASRESSLILFNIAKQRNFGNLIRSADAFGVREVVVVGRKRFSAFGAKGTRRFLRFVHCLDLAAARDYLKSRDFWILGIEILSGAVPIESHPFRERTAFMLGNEGVGLTERQLEICDGLAFIRQFGHCASVNVNVAGAICLHHFSIWAGWPTCPHSGGKFRAHEPENA